MLNNIKNIYRHMIPIALIMAILFLGNWLYIGYTGPKEIQRSYSGIMYKNGKFEPVEQINIKISGKYSRGLFGEADEFEGTILIGEKVLTLNKYPIKFNKNNMGLLSLGPIPEDYGMIFISNMFEKMTIQLIANQQDQWISAPCVNREEAVNLSNELIQRVSKGLRNF
ncbi:hypothetical protein ACHOLT_11640 [Desulfitobacterium sp. Sab5]|uniref:hypothetical protein n=1 Tax=Desulfitobacterium nosdiversum TaxID=3375356 RepID=UPI003CF89963